MAHLPLIMSPSGGKLSKRNAEKMGIPVSVRQYREEGYEPEALVNFLAFLGWNPGTEEEVFSLDGLADAFSLDRIGQSGAQFDLDKLRWYNEQHLRRLSPDDLAERARPALEVQGYSPDVHYLREVAALMQERVTFAADLATTCPYFYEDPTSYDEQDVQKRWKDDSAGLLSAYADRLEAQDDFTGRDGRASPPRPRRSPGRRGRSPDPPDAPGRQRCDVRAGPLRHDGGAGGGRLRSPSSPGGRGAGVSGRLGLPQHEGVGGGKLWSEGALRGGVGQLAPTRRRVGTRAVLHRRALCHGLFVEACW